MEKIFELIWPMVLISFSICLAESTGGQHSNIDNLNKALEEVTKTRTELLNELSLKLAIVDLKHTEEEHERYKREYENSQLLFDESIISKKELDEALSAYTRAQQQLGQAQIRLEQTKLGFLANATHITILEAKKYYDSENRRMLDLVLKNTSNLTQAESAIGLTDGKLQSSSTWQSPEQIQALLDIENIIVSVVNNLSSIGKPYEQIIPVLPYGKEKRLTFILLTDVREAGIELHYLDQDITEILFLEKESLQKIPTMIATQFSQEGQLNSDISYDIELEMLITTNKSFSLTVTNLPPQIPYSFLDTKTNARVNRVGFTEEVSRHSLKLNVSIPKNLDLEMIDKSINFQAWVIERAQLEKINALRQTGQHHIERTRLDEFDGSRVELSLIPKGIGKLEIIINNLLEEVKPNQQVALVVELHNIGTLPLFNITPNVNTPLGWKAELSRKGFETLLPDEKKPFTINLVPGADVSVGEYEAQLAAKGQSGSEIIEALEKRVHIRVVDKANIIMTIVLVCILVVLVGGVVVAGVKLSRR